MKVLFCRACGRVTLRGFAFCPYCGAVLKSGPAVDRVYESFDRLETMQTESRSRRIVELLAELDDLEADVEAILQGAASPG